MDTKTSFLIDHLEKKSNTILGFVVVQSIFLADKLSDDSFIEKIQGIPGFYNFLFIAHSVILVLAVTFLIILERKIGRRFDDDLRNAIQPMATTIVKIFVVLIFGLLPVIIFLHRTF